MDIILVLGIIAGIIFMIWAVITIAIEKNGGS